jgi:hypothetical protein
MIPQRPRHESGFLEERHQGVRRCRKAVDLADQQPAAVDAATWPSLLGPVPDVTNPKGGLVFLSDAQRHIVDTHYNNFGPRVSLAYQATPNTVLRAGYGLFYAPTEFGTSGAGLGGTDGFMQITNWQTTMNGDGVTPWARMSDPFAFRGSQARA